MAMTFTQELIATQQRELAAYGYYTGKIDGDEGPLTRMAFSRFKAAHGMIERPYPGKLTMTALWSGEIKPYRQPAAADETVPWVAEGLRLLGVKETPGAGDNPVIMDWALRLGQWYTGDDVPWCGLFVAHCMATGAPDVPQDFNRLGARAWSAYGVECPVGYGAVARFWRTHPTNSWHGHVGIIVGAKGDDLHVLGGNQDDMVSVIPLPRRRLLGCCCPPGFEPVTKLTPSPLVGRSGKLV